MSFPTDINQIPPPQGAINRLPADSQKAVSPPTNVTQADLDEFRGELRDSMMGEQYSHMDASRYDLQGRGLYTQQPALNPEPAPPPVEQMALPLEQPPQDWQQLYGQSENEKGNWRRMAEQQSQQLLLLQQQIAAIQNQPTAVPQAAPQVPLYQDPGFDPFPELRNEELATWGEIKQMIKAELLPTIDLRARQAQDAATARAQRLMPQWDVSPQEEQMALQNLRARFAGLESRFTATEINSMVQDQALLARGSQGGGPVGSIQPPVATPVGTVRGTAAAPNQPTRPVFIDPNRLVRRQTYIESAPPAQVQVEPSVTLNPAQAFQAELTAFERQAGRRATAVEYGNMLVKHGVARVNDFGTDVSTR